jgi:hypothetical protein
MSFPNNASIGQQLLDVPFPAMIRSMGLAIAEAQFELDRVGLRMAQMMAGKYQIEVVDPDDPEKTVVEEREAYVSFDGKSMSMLELGFTPTFYQFVDTIIEVKISISMSYSSEYKKASSRSSTSRASPSRLLQRRGVRALQLGQRLVRVEVPVFGRGLEPAAHQAGAGAAARRARGAHPPDLRARRRGQGRPVEPRLSRPTPSPTEPIDD